MWNSNTLWFEVAIVSIILVIGQICLGHFEERAPRWKKLLKTLSTFIIVLYISIFFGRTAAFIILGLWMIPVLYIHVVLLPKKGINGWTGEPKSKYYDFRGWDKNILGKEKK